MRSWSWEFKEFDMSHIQDEVYEHSLRDPESFWAHQAEQLSWHKRPSRTLLRKRKHLKSGVEHAHWSWFPDGEISTAYNCVDRHVAAGNGDRDAIIWDSPVSGSKQTYTYNQLLDEVEVLAGVLQEAGVNKGDVVIVYMPMIPQALIALLAITRLGAIHAVVFGGFSAASLAQRIESSSARFIMTASCGIEGGKGPASYKPMVTGAIEKSSFKPERVLVWQREALRWDPIRKDQGELNWNKLVKSARSRGIRAKSVPVRSNDGVYIIYTSGTTVCVVRDRTWWSQTLTRIVGPSKGRFARDCRPPSRPQFINKISFRHSWPRGYLFLRFRHWLGCRPLVHFVRPSPSRSRYGPVRRQACWNPRRRNVLAHRHRASGECYLYRSNRATSDQKGGSRQQVFQECRHTWRFETFACALPGRREK